MRSSRFLRHAIFVALAMMSARAHATAAGVTPTIVSGYPAVENPVFGTTPNTMMYRVTVRVSDAFPDAAHTAVVGFTDVAPKRGKGCSTGRYKYAQPQVFDTDVTRTWTLYNFQPGTSYYYKVQIGAAGSGRTYCGKLSTFDAPVPTLPDNLDALHLEVTRASGAAVHTN